MDKVNKTVSKYYLTLAEVYQTGLVCEDCRFVKDTKLCYKNKDYCAERLYLFMKRLLDTKQV